MLISSKLVGGFGSAKLELVWQNPKPPLAKRAPKPEFIASLIVNVKYFTSALHTGAGAPCSWRHTVCTRRIWYTPAERSYTRSIAQFLLET